MTIILYDHVMKITDVSILNLTTSSESQWHIDSNDILSVRKYSQLFTHELNTYFSANNTWFRPFKWVRTQTDRHTKVKTVYPPDLADIIINVCTNEPVLRAVECASGLSLITPASNNPSLQWLQKYAVYKLNYYLFRMQYTILG